MYKILYNLYMDIGIYCNRAAKKFVLIEKELLARLKERGIIPKIYDKVEQIDRPDALVVLGGDGTILKVAIEAGRRGVNILGINAGNLGFLTEFEGEQVEEAVKLLESEYEIENRSVLEVTVHKEKYYALNEAVFQRSYNPSVDDNVVAVNVSIEGKKVDTFVGDGVIVSTPTGSTAYSLSAGGSILTPDISAFILTPVCAHSLHNRPIVFSDASKLEIELCEEGPGLALYCDGKYESLLHRTEKAYICKANFNVGFIKGKNSNFFDKLLFKLNKWSK